MEMKKEGLNKDKSMKNIQKLNIERNNWIDS